jgi:hypothetical protein
MSANPNARDMSTSALSAHPAPPTGAAAAAGAGRDQEAGATVSFRKDATATAVPAPLYITIGPPCAGKTTWLANHQGRTKPPTIHATAATAAATGAAAGVIPIRDVCIDDQEGVYVPVDTALFLDSSLLSVPDTNNNNNSQANERATNNRDSQSSGTSEAAQGEEKVSWFGQTVRQRIAAPEQAELVTVLQRCAGLLTAEQFVARIQGLYRNHSRRNNNRDNDQQQQMVAQALIQAVDKAVAVGESNSSTDSDKGKAHSLLVLPPTTDLFVLQSLFMVDPNKSNTTGTTPTTGTGIERALAALRAVDPGVPVAWGNTNTKPTDYKAALLLAAQQRRPVHFVVYHANCSSTGIKRSNNDATAAEEGPNNVALGTFEDVCWDLTVPSWQDLLERSVHRLLQTGRYVPASVIWDMHGRTQQMVRSVADHCQRDIVESQAKQSGDNSSTVGSTTSSRHRLDKLELDRGLARLCGFDMNERRLVSEGYRVPAAKQPRRDNYRSDNNIRGGGSHRQQRSGDRPPRRGPPERPWAQQNRARPGPRGPPPPNSYHGPQDGRDDGRIHRRGAPPSPYERFPQGNNRRPPEAPSSNHGPPQAGGRQQNHLSQFAPPNRANTKTTAARWREQRPTR